MEGNEERYEHIDILIKSPTGEESWFDRLFDYITSFCHPDGVWGEDENGDWAEINECTCGMESMGGSSGTLDQCYDHMRLTEKWAFDVRAEDLKIALEFVDDSFKDTVQYQRLRDAAFWHDDFNERYSNLEEDDDGTTDI